MSLPLLGIRTSSAQKCPGGKCNWPDHREEGGRESDLVIFTMELLYSGIRKKKRRDSELGWVDGRCSASLAGATPRVNESLETVHL